MTGSCARSTAMGFAVSIAGGGCKATAAEGAVAAGVGAGCSTAAETNGRASNRIRSGESPMVVEVVESVFSRLIMQQAGVVPIDSR